MKMKQRIYEDENGKCSVTVKGQTCSAPKTKEFKDFTQRVAELAHGIKSDNWDNVKKVFPELEKERQIVEKVIEEDVKVDNIELMLV
jgi:hypothetical protein